MKGTLITILMLLLAGGAALGAGFLANSYIDKSVAQRRKQLESQYEPVRVVVANADLKPGAVLDKRVIAAREVPRAFVHSEAISPSEWNHYAGMKLAVALKGGEPILRSHLATNPSSGFSSMLEDGKRALTFGVDDESSIAGFLAPGDRIDLFLTVNNGHDSVTLPLLYAVPVIATGAQTQSNARLLAKRQLNHDYTNITVGVTPQEAEKITHAQAAGKLTVALRRPGDARPLQLPKVTKNTLLYGDRPSAPGRRAIEVILGGA